MINNVAIKNEMFISALRMLCDAGKLHSGRRADGENVGSILISMHNTHIWQVAILASKQIIFKRVADDALAALKDQASARPIIGIDMDGPNTEQVVNQIILLLIKFVRVSKVHVAIIDLNSETAPELVNRGSRWKTGKNALRAN